jgi:hypothetical protein
MTESNKARYFDLIVEGVGYLNRIRTVQPKGKAKPYLACTVKAFCGGADEIEYRSCDLIVVGKQAKDAIGILEPLVKANQAVIVGFRFGDVRPDQYQVKSRETGEVDVRFGLKGRLLQLTFAKADGQVVQIPLVERPRRDEPADESGDGAPALKTGTDG